MSFRWANVNLAILPTVLRKQNESNGIQRININNIVEGVSNSILL
ncbi:MAG TPA: hypothetical protein PK079_20445 [Leptospiraceae bacterium]|nr:hypothetical protein [Leptospiraceae bacterium]HMX32159.1 hypothetical protein [Leptospiraceae bacterium]HMY32229.1 hypothetical protein [Leptospiraceae bacterium]HMZ67161.1 hypothetical protein [Leptospiraceae bacterium]HNA09741.1 hypothetical protein [Leptospiraceae bacterium]